MELPSVQRLRAGSGDISSKGQDISVKANKQGACPLPHRMEFLASRCIYDYIIVIASFSQMK